MKKSKIQRRIEKFSTYNFNKKWLTDKSGYWYEKKFKVNDILNGMLYFDDRFMTIQFYTNDQYDTIDKETKSEKKFIEWCENFVNLPKQKSKAYGQKRRTKKDN